MAGRRLVLDHSSGLKLHPLQVVDLKGEHLLCGGRECPHYHGQLPLLPNGPADMYCAVDGGAISQACHPYYLGVAEALSELYGRGRPSSGADLLADLDEAEALEARRIAAARTAEVSS